MELDLYPDQVDIFRTDIFGGVQAVGRLDHVICGLGGDSVVHGVVRPQVYGVIRSTHRYQQLQPTHTGTKRCRRSEVEDKTLCELRRFWVTPWRRKVGRTWSKGRQRGLGERSFLQSGLRVAPRQYYFSTESSGWGDGISTETRRSPMPLWKLTDRTGRPWNSGRCCCRGLVFWRTQ